MADLGEFMNIERHEAGTRSSQIVVHDTCVYLSGIVSSRADRRNAAEQTEDILAVIDAHLIKAGSSRSRLLTATIWLADVADFAVMNAVWEAWIPAGCAPARATVQALLVEPKYKVEIMVTAAL
jgi:enamine deaminase RidA (YjgF/YER057c/UK114 family)